MKLLLAALSLLLMALPAHAVTITEVTITDIGPVTATIRFKTDVGAKATLMYLPLGQTPNANGTYPGMGTAIETNTGPTIWPTNHWLGLGNLYSNADYLVRIHVVAADGKTDTTPPVISNIVVKPTRTGLLVTFRTNEKSGSVGLMYGLPIDTVLRGYRKFYNLNYNLIYVPLDHTVEGSGLLPDTSYIYKLWATDLQNNKAVTKQATFRTLK